MGTYTLVPHGEFNLVLAGSAYGFGVFAATLYAWVLSDVLGRADFHETADRLGRRAGLLMGGTYLWFWVLGAAAIA